MLGGVLTNIITSIGANKSYEIARKTDQKQTNQKPCIATTQAGAPDFTFQFDLANEL